MRACLRCVSQSFAAADWIDFEDIEQRWNKSTCWTSSAARLSASTWLMLTHRVAMSVCSLNLLQAVRNKNLEAKPSDKPKQVNLLDLKRCTAVGIRMARLKVPWQSVGCAILSLDGAAFEGADDISTVLQCVPSEEEKGVLQVRVCCC
jgi:hypothetical protein